MVKSCVPMSRCAARCMATASSAPRRHARRGRGRATGGARRMSDAVAVVAADRRIARVEAVRDRLGAQGSAIGSGRRCAFSPSRSLSPVHSRTRSKCATWPSACTPASVRPAPRMRRLLAGQPDERLLDRLLHRAPVRLPLPADEGRAVILDRQLVAGHLRRALQRRADRRGVPPRAPRRRKGPSDRATGIRSRNAPRGDCCSRSGRNNCGSPTTTDSVSPMRGEAGVPLAHEPRGDALLLILGVDGERRQRHGAERRFAAFHHQPREGDIADDDALILGHQRQHDVAVAAQRCRPGSPRRSPGSDASSRSRICGASRGSSRRITTMPLQRSASRRPELLGGLPDPASRRGSACIERHGFRKCAARSTLHAQAIASRRQAARRAGIPPPRRASCRRAAPRSARAAPVAAGDDERVEAEDRARRARPSAGASPRSTLTRSLPPATRGTSHQAPGKGDRPRMRLCSFSGRSRPVDARLRLVDLGGVGDASLRLRRAVERAALQRRERPHHQVGAERRQPVVQLARRLVRRRSARARRGRPGRCRALPPCA